MIEDSCYAGGLRFLTSRLSSDAIPPDLLTSPCLDGVSEGSLLTDAVIAAVAEPAGCG